jgi:hypothetical protein
MIQMLNLQDMAFDMEEAADSEHSRHGLGLRIGDSLRY